MKLSNKINKLTTIQSYKIENLMNLIEEVCCDDILNKIEEGSDAILLDIGVGSLSILIDEDSISYKFIPSEEFENMVVKTIETGKSPLIDHLNKGITSKIIDAYKNLM